MSDGPDSPATRPDVTGLLRQWSGGDAVALERLMEVVYDELKRIARGVFRGEREGHTLEPTALVNELYVRLVDRPALEVRDRLHFYAVAARMMRHLLVDHARGRQAQRRRAILVAMDDAEEPPVPGYENGTDVLALHEALERLAADHPREAEVVELRYFGGMTLQETAAYLGIADGTVKRDWRFARSWLFTEIGRAGSPP